MRQLASDLATPMLVVGPEGDLLFFNEPAEILLGRRFDEIGELGVEEWSGIFDPAAEDGSPISAEERPMLRAIGARKPAHGRLTIRGFDGRRRRIAATALPLLERGGRNLGALCIFWEVQSA